LRTEKERLQVELQSSVERITEFHPAEAPRTKNLRTQIMMMASAGLFFFVLGAFGVSLWECRAQRVDAQDELVSSLGARVVGTLPALRDQSRKAAPKGDDVYWENLWKESIDGVRTVLLHEADRESYRVLMVTSAGPREGKTTLASHLAISIAATGRRTLLIDGDLRRPVLHRLLEVEQGPGLCEVLLGLDPFEAIRLSSVPNLSLLPAGQVSRPVIQALGQDKLAPILERLRAEYEFILIDSSPVLLVNDALLMGQHVDGVLLSIRPHTSQLPKVHAAYERLAAVHIRTVGMVYNGAFHKPRRHEYHYLSRLED
jgi:capsular exopolysaccharide synthesis family protein